MTAPKTSSPLGACLREAASAKAGERIEVRRIPGKREVP
jgi:hypothetical protein